MSNLNDKKVLNAILNPNTPFEESENEQQIPATSKYEMSDDVVEAKNLEAKGVKAAENHDLERSIDMFTNAINKAPHWASSYNNRAQAYRLLGKIDDALNDLEKAITLSTEYEDLRVLSLATTQKGILLRLKGNDEEAYNCFKKGAQYGNAFSKRQVLCLNPYAALCNRMLADVFDKLKKGESYS